jgi:AcrR family transcriptional regulator
MMRAEVSKNQMRRQLNSVAILMGRGPMPRKHSTVTDKIIAAAAKLFANQGYHATSTREIAHLAGVSENTLFRHFNRKEDLFWTTLRTRAAILTPQWDLINGIRAGDAPAVILPKLCELLANTVNHKSEVLRLFAIAFVELRDKSESFCKELLSPLVSEFDQYLARSVAKGEVADVDPSLAAASLLGMVLIHPHISKMMTFRSESPADSECTAVAYGKFWLDVLTPRPVPRSAPISHATM